MSSTALAETADDMAGASPATSAGNVDDRLACIASILTRTNSFVYRCHADDAYTMFMMEGAVAALTGRDPQHFLGPNRGSYAACIHPDDAAHVDAAVEAAVATKSVWAVEYRIARPGRDPIWVSETGAGVFGPDGGLEYLEGQVVDATARRQADSHGRNRDAEIRDRTAAMTKEIIPVLELLKTLKILAINARVEAARAGDAGRGFTVVASEVGELASKSDSRARAIADLTNELSALLEDGRQDG